MDYKNFPPIGGLMVSKMVAEEKIKPGFMYREKRVRDEDSGWRIFSGQETEGYTENPDNSDIYDPATILEIDDSIAFILLNGGIGSAFERIGESTKWKKVEGFELEDDYLVKHRLTEDWTIKINNLFERELEANGDLLYTTGDKSVRLTIWNENGKLRQQIADEHQQTITSRNQSASPTLTGYDFSDDQVSRLGYLIKESDGRKEYSVVYGFSIIDNQTLMAAIYFDDANDLDWALETWKGIVIEKK